MSIDERTIRRVAELARLELTPEEMTTYTAQLSKVVDHIDQLAEFGGLEESLSAGLREADDVVAPSLAVEEFLANAPARLDRFLTVPQVKKADG